MRPVLSCLASPETRPTPPNEPNHACTYSYDYHHHRTYAQCFTVLASEDGRGHALLVFLPTLSIAIHPCALKDTQDSVQQYDPLTNRGLGLLALIHLSHSCNQVEQSSRSSTFCLSHSSHSRSCPSRCAIFCIFAFHLSCMYQCSHAHLFFILHHTSLLFFFFARGRSPHMIYFSRVSWVD